MNENLDQSTLTSPVYVKALSFGDKERRCEQHFDLTMKRYGEIWHICTPGNLSELLFTDDDDYRFGVSNSAISAAESGLVILTDAIMSNHIHVLGAGSKGQCLNYVDYFRYRLGRYFLKKGRFIKLNEFRCDEPIAVTSLESLRNEIVYINRNGYLVNPSHNPFSYPWGSGSAYFNPALKAEQGIPYDEVPFRTKRFLCRRRVSPLPERYRFGRGIILPASYALCHVGEMMFRDAHHYFNHLTKNIEAYSEEARRLGDSIILTDEEIYPAVKMICWRDFKIGQPSLLPLKSKIEVARIMCRDYHASANQIRRILRLPQEAFEQLFPSAKVKP